MKKVSIDWDEGTIEWHKEEKESSNYGIKVSNNLLKILDSLYEKARLIQTKEEIVYDAILSFIERKEEKKQAKKWRKK